MEGFVFAYWLEPANANNSVPAKTVIDPNQCTRVKILPKKNIEKINDKNFRFVKQSVTVNEEHSVVNLNMERIQKYCANSMINKIMNGFDVSPNVLCSNGFKYHSCDELKKIFVCKQISSNVVIRKIGNARKCFQQKKQN